MLLATSCSSWKAQVKPVREVVEPGPSGDKKAPTPPDSIRVLCDNLEPTVVYRPFIRGDSLLGTVEGMTARPAAEDRSGPRPARISHERPFAVPLDSVRRVEVYKKRAGEDLLLFPPVFIGAFLVGAFVVVVVIHPAGKARG
jgi:hypothetical protein